MFEILNHIGSILLLVATLPQFYLAYKNRKKLQDISIFSYSAQLTACVILAVWTAFNQLYSMFLLELGFGIYAGSIVILALKRKKMIVKAEIKTVRRLVKYAKKQNKESL